DQGPPQPGAGLRCQGCLDGTCGLGNGTHRNPLEPQGGTHRNPQAGRGGTPGTPEGSARGGGNGLLPPGSQGWQPGITAGRANPARGGGNGRQGGGQPAVARGGHLQV